MVARIVAYDTANWRGEEGDSASAEVKDWSVHVGKGIVDGMPRSTKFLGQGGILH